MTRGADIRVFAQDERSQVGATTSFTRTRPSPVRAELTADRLPRTVEVATKGE